MDIETYDIFSGRTDKQPLWIESVEGLDAAKQRMHDFAASTPGPYFVYRVSTQAVLAFTDTSEAGGGGRVVLVPGLDSAQSPRKSGFLGPTPPSE
jgi:hypothetical protein